MKLEFVPLLQKQRDLCDIPRGEERFRAYLWEMIDPETRDLRLPLAALNPMAKDHVPALTDALLALDVERAATEATGDAAARLALSPGSFKSGDVPSLDAVQTEVLMCIHRVDHIQREGPPRTLRENDHTGGLRHGLRRLPGARS